MANVWGDIYPENLEELLNESKQIANCLVQDLNNPKLPILDELYEYKGKDIYYKHETFKLLGGHPNKKKKETDKLNNELMGLYLFGEITPEGVIPVYIGISRTIYRRLKQHGWGKLHNECTFAYLRANHHHFNSEYKNGRKEFPVDMLETSKKEIREFKLALCPILDDYEMYFHEVAIAALLRCSYNKFKTH